MTKERLKEILDHVRGQGDLVAKNGITYCNIALNRVLGFCDMDKLMAKSGEPMLANDMCDHFRDSSDWQKIDGYSATSRAMQGILVIACQKGPRHGHVAPVYPSPMEYSASWQKEVPILSNVGKDNVLQRASKCFQTEPTHSFNFSSDVYIVTGAYYYRNW